MQSHFITLQRWLIAHKKQIILCFQIFEGFLVGLLILGSYFILTNPAEAFSWYVLGIRFGYIALLFYLLTLLPGIFSRLQWLPLLGVMMMPFRRHFGIIMFICAFIHQAFTTTVPTLAFGAALSLGGAKIFGFLALVVLFPLWLTSNDVSQKYLGRKWKILHRLTYLALFLIFLHVAFFRKRWMILTVIVMILELYSWLVVWWQVRAAKKASSPPPLPPTQ